MLHVCMYTMTYRESSNISTPHISVSQHRIYPSLFAYLIGSFRKDIVANERNISVNQLVDNLGHHSKTKDLHQNYHHNVA